MSENDNLESSKMRPSGGNINPIETIPTEHLNQEQIRNMTKEELMARIIELSQSKD